MDARHVVTELRARLGGLPTSDTRRMVEAFFAFAAEPASYEDGQGSTDTVFLSASVIDESTEASLASPAIEPVQLVGDGGELDFGFAPDGTQYDQRIGCRLLFALTADVLALPTDHTIRAPAATATTPAREPYDVERLADVPEVFRISPIGPLLNRHADDYWPAVTI